MISDDLFFLDSQDSVSDETIVLKSKEVHHIHTVLRKKLADKLTISDGEKNWYRTEIESLNKTHVQCRILEKHDIAPQQTEIILYNALLKGGQFDLQIEKSVELGVSEIQPLITDHIEANKSKLHKWKSIILKACKQCKQLRLVKIHEPEKLVQLSQADDVTWLVAEIDQSTKIMTKEMVSEAKKIAIFIGPEGGFSQQEIAFFKQKNAQFISLGDLRLRAETAAWSAISRIKLLTEEDL